MMDVTLRSLFYVCGLGALGVGARFVLASLSAKFFPYFPVGTFGINILGSFLIGLLTALANDKSLISYEMRNYLAIGFLGGFTTFSAFSFEVVQMWEKGFWFYAIGYFVLSPLLGVISALCGICLVRNF